MTKKDYSRIVNALRALPDPAPKKDVAVAVARALIGSNLKFNPFKFVEDVARGSGDKAKLKVVS